MKHVSYPPATNLQKGCFKLWQRQMATALNDSGYTIRQAIEQDKLRLDVPWTEFTFEQVFTFAYMTIMHPDATSISDLNTKQLTDLYEAINEGVAKVFGVSLPFPSEDSL